MTDTVEVVAARPLMIPAGRLEEGELFPAIAAHAAQLAAMGALTLAKGDGSALDRAIAAGATARKELDARFAREAKDAADAEKAADAKAAKAAKTEKEA